MTKELKEKILACLEGNYLAGKYRPGEYIDNLLAIIDRELEEIRKEEFKVGYYVAKNVAENELSGTMKG